MTSWDSREAFVVNVEHIELIAVIASRNELARKRAGDNYVQRFGPQYPKTGVQGVARD
jgi:hypothetical protein